MSLPARVEPILPLVETLVGCQDPLLRDRVLVQAASTCLQARGIALWRPTSEPGGASGWRAVLTLGDPADLPQPSEVQAVLEGTLGSELDSKRHVLAGPEGAHAWALGISGATDEEGLALVEALFVLALTLEPDIDPIQPPLPSSPPGESDTAGSESNELRHDLRNLLTTVRSAYDYVELFADELDDDETRRVDEAVSRDLDRIGRLFVRAIDGSSEPVSAWSPTQLVLDVLDSLRPEFEAAELSIEATHLEAVDAPGDLTELDAWRIVENLVRNALEALGTQGATGSGVALSWTRAQSSIVLCVEDDGPGLPLPSAALFEPGITIGKESGSGLGLSIVRDLVERSGGRVLASTRPNGGASFHVSWPAPGPGGATGH